jgi:nucleotide-binding universal stress UspA family protein
MAPVLKPEWSKPGIILFAAEIPTNETAFSHALAQAVEYQATLVLFHASNVPQVMPRLIDGMDTGVRADLVAGLEYFEPDSMHRAEARALAPLARRVREAGVHCRTMVRPGSPADQILETARDTGADRIVMGTHSPGHIGKLLVGSVAESVLRRANVPVYIVGPDVEASAERSFAPRTVLCAVSRVESSGQAAAFAAELAARHHARLVIQHVFRPQDCKDVLAEHCIAEMERQLLNMVPTRFRQKVHPKAVAMSGDPTEKLLEESRNHEADVIVMGAYGASTFAAITRHGIVYRVLASAHCPVITLSPSVLEAGVSRRPITAPSESYLAGVI